MSKPSTQALTGFTFAGKTYKVVPLDQIRVDPKYQRQLNLAVVEGSDNPFDERAVRALTVSLRGDSLFYVMDGYHRYERLRANGDDHAVCEIHEGLKVKEEAALFVLLNRVKVVSPVAKFRAAYVAGQPGAVTVWRCVERNGFHIQFGSGRRRKDVNYVSCVAALEKIYARQGPEILDDTLSLTAECMKTGTGVLVQAAARRDLFLSGLALYLFENQPERADVVGMLSGTDAAEMIQQVEQDSGAARKDAIKHFAKYLKNRMAARNRKGTAGRKTA